MQPDVWYKASDLMNVLGVRETRTKELLRALITDEKLVDDGATKESDIRKPMNYNRKDTKWVKVLNIEA